jgi:hypothetical protein
MHLPAKQGRSQESYGGSTPPPFRLESCANWKANGPENRAGLLSRQSSNLWLSVYADVAQSGRGVPLRTGRMRVRISPSVSCRDSSIGRVSSLNNRKLWGSNSTPGIWLVTFAVLFDG